MSFVIKRGNKYIVKGGIIGSETSDVNQALKFETVEEVKSFMQEEALRPEKHTIEVFKDAIIPHNAKTLEVTLKRDISNGKAGDKVVLKRNERGEWSDGKYMYPVQMLRTPEVCEVRVVDKKSFEVKYKDKKFKVLAKDHKEAANKLLRSMKDAATLTEKEYYQVLDKIPRFENVEIYFNTPRFGGGLEARVNWSAIGSVDTDKAKKFIADLQKAVKIVDDLNKKYGGYKVTYSDCGSVLKDGAEENDKEFLKNAIEEMERYVSNWSFMTASEKRNVGMDRNQLRNKIDEYRRKLATLKDTKTKDYAVTATRREGTDKIVYALQSDVDKNLYFYIGKTFSMKDGDFSYQKYEMNGVTPEALRAELLRNGWHEVKSYPQHIIDSCRTKDEYVKGPRGEFKLSEKTRSELEKEGYGFHHSFETKGGRYSVMTKNNEAVACRDSK